jgi:hypothetical protein
MEDIDDILNEQEQINSEDIHFSATNGWTFTQFRDYMNENGFSWEEEDMIIAFEAWAGMYRQKFMDHPDEFVEDIKRSRRS